VIKLLAHAVTLLIITRTLVCQQVHSTGILMFFLYFNEIRKKPIIVWPKVNIFHLRTYCKTRNGLRNGLIPRTRHVHRILTTYLYLLTFPLLVSSLSCMQATKNRVGPENGARWACHCSSIMRIRQEGPMILFSLALFYEWIPPANPPEVQTNLLESNWRINPTQCKKYILGS